jgi:hypothetical protein
MAEYNTTSGAWLDVNDELDGKRIALVNECVQTPSDKFKNEDGSPKMTNLAKAQVQGLEGTFNVRPNWTSVYALIEAYGRDSKSWIGRQLTAKVKDATTGQSLYMVPDGFELIRDKQTKRWTIRKVEGAAAPQMVPGTGIEYPAEADDLGDPFAPSEPVIE